MSDLVDDETGRPAVVRAVRLDRELGRPVEGPLPDVCVAWAPDVPARRLRSARLGVFDAPGRDPRAGVHRPPGYLLGAVPGLAGSGAARLVGAEADLIDVGPTVLGLLGVDPSPLPGRPIAKLTPGG